MTQNALEAALAGAILAVIAAVIYRLKYRRAKTIPLDALYRVRRYLKWIEFDIMERDRRKSQMSESERSELRQDEAAYYDYFRKIPDGDLDRLIAESEARQPDFQ